MSLTEGQKKFCSERTMKIGDVKILPRYGFTAYSTPNGEKFYMDSNPFTKSLDKSPVIIVDEEEGFYKVKFEKSRRYEPPFYVRKYEMESREGFEVLFLRLFLWPFFTIYNLFRKDEV